MVSDGRDQDDLGSVPTSDQDPGFETYLTAARRHAGGGIAATAMLHRARRARKMVVLAANILAWVIWRDCVGNIEVDKSWRNSNNGQ